MQVIWGCCYRTHRNGNPNFIWVDTSSQPHILQRSLESFAPFLGVSNQTYILCYKNMLFIKIGKYDFKAYRSTEQLSVSLIL